jgi:UDP-glucose 4-epimerase
MTKQSRVLVTGAAGFIGSHTCDLLLTAGHVVCGVDNFRTGRVENLWSCLSHPEFMLREADVSEPEVFDEIIAQFAPSAIIHLAGLVSVQESIANPTLNFRLNLQATHVVADGARRHGVGRVVFSSSAAVYGESTKQALNEAAASCVPLSPYGAAKLSSEDLLLGYARTYPLTAVCLRYFNVYGPRQDPGSQYCGVITAFSQCFMEGRSATIFGDGDQSRDFISVHDVARANLLAATLPTLPSSVLNICSGRGTSLLELIGSLSRHFGGSGRAEHAPERIGDIRYSLGDPSAAKRILGFQSAWTVDTGLGELAQAPETLSSRL